jgi:hypothetical protein
MDHGMLHRADAERLETSLALEGETAMTTTWKITGLCAILLVVTAAAQPALAHEWEGLTWTFRGTTTATNQGDGSILIETVAKSSGDPGLDNWVLTAPLPKLEGANPMWMEFSFLDQTAGTYGDGPRAYASASHDNGETLIQGGVYTGYANYVLNYSRSEGGNWEPTTWYFADLRSNAEHTFKVGVFHDGSVGLWFDGLLVDTIVAGDYTNLPVDGFTRAYLGLTTSGSGQPASVVYTSFSYGYAPVPEPATMTLLGLGLAAVVARKRRSR